MTNEKLVELEKLVTAANQLQWQIQELDRNIASIKNCSVLALSAGGTYVLGRGNIGGCIGSIAPSKEWANWAFLNARDDAVRQLELDKHDLQLTFDAL